MNNCVHQWIYIGSKRQDVWRCIFCDEYKINDATPQRPWQGLTEEEMDEAEDVGAKEYRRWKSQIRGQLFMPQDCPEWHIYRAIEAKLKEKNS